MKKRLERVRGGASYPCPKCGTPTRVLETRRPETDIERKRICACCGHRFTTLERETVPATEDR